MAGNVDGFPHRLPCGRLGHGLGRRCRADLLPRGKFYGIALFAIDRTGSAHIPVGILHDLLDIPQHLDGIPFRCRRGNGGTRIFAAPDIFHRVALGFFGFLHRFPLGVVDGGRFFLPGFGNHNFFRCGFPACKQSAQKAALFGRFRFTGLRLPVREIFLLGLLRQRSRFFCFQGIVFLLGTAAQRNVDGHKFIGIFGGFQPEQTALLAARFPDFALLVGYHGHRIPEKLLKLIFARIQCVGIGAGFGGHFEQKALDNAGAGGIAQRAGIHRLLGRFLLSGPCLLRDRSGRLYRLARDLRLRAGGRPCRGSRALYGCRRFLPRLGFRRAAQFLPAIQVIQPRKRDFVVLFRRAVQRCGRNTHTAQDLIHLMVGHRVLDTGRRLLLVEILQNAVHRIIGTFAWHV